MNLTDILAGKAPVAPDVTKPDVTNPPEDTTKPGGLLEPDVTKEGDATKAEDTILPPVAPAPSGIFLCVGTPQMKILRKDGSILAAISPGRFLPESKEDVTLCKALVNQGHLIEV